MDEEQQPSSGRRKLKFTPKAPPQRKLKSTSLPKAGVNDIDTNNNEDESVQAEKLMNKFNANLRRQVPKIEKKSSVQVAFGPGATSSTSIRQFGVPRGENYGGSSRTGIKDSTDVDDDGKIVTSLSSTANEDGAITWPSDAGDALPLKIKRDYKEPWDYHHTYYPTTLPLRRPYCGDPELLNEAEFGKDARNLEYDEKTINPASDLGLLEECDNQRMFFFQLPGKLPLVKRSASAKGKEKAESSTPSEGKKMSKISGSLEALSEGYMGKMLVYRSGAVKLKLGDILYDVSPGSDCIFAQDVMAINTAAKQCCAIGELGKRVVVTPNVDSLLNSVIDLG